MNTKDLRKLKSKNKIVLVLAILANLLISLPIITLAVDDLANPVIALTEEELAAKTRDDNPEVTKYLVSDESISRVLPNTTLKDFISNFREEKIKIYKDKDCTEELTAEEIETGKVYSGLFVKYELNERVYEISVIGDMKTNPINQNAEEQNYIGDSNLNEIDCTRIIRGIAGADKWKITKEPEIKSADLDFNNKLEKSDVKKVVNYIVFGELEVKDIEKVNSPSLKVTKGYKNEDGSFEGRATVTLEQTAQNGTRNIYRIANKEDQYIEIEDKGEINLEQAGTYTIVAYTYGEDGSKSKGEVKTVVVTEGIYTLTLIPGENISTVRGGGEYKFGDTIRINATLATPAPGYEITWDSWISSDEQRVQNKADKEAEIVMPKGNITLTAKANKNTIDYSISYNLNGGSLEEGKVNPTSFTIESERIVLNNPSREGYEFKGWVENNEDEPNTEFTIEPGSIGNKEITAIYEKLPAEEYIVQYYKEDLTGSNYVLSETVRYSDDIGTRINAREKGYIKNIPGFSFDTDLQDNVLTGKVVKAENDEGRLTLKLYYKRNIYTVTLAKNEDINKVLLNTILTQETEEGLVGRYKYEQPVTIKALFKDDAGYIYSFDKWESATPNLIGNQSDRESNFTMPAGNVKLTAIANKVAREDTPYVIEYYYQKTDGTYPSSVTEEYRRERIGKTDETATLNNQDKQPTIAGYVYDENNPNNVTSGKIKGDGSLVLKVYFKKQYTVTYLRGAHGTFGNDQIGGVRYSGLDYGSATPNLDTQITGEPGYEFKGWDREIARTVTGDETYTARWSPLTYYISYSNLYNNENFVTSYDVETETFTIGQPTRYGYSFAGWTGSNGTQPQTTVTIQKGSTGDKYYTANWIPEVYTITYDLRGGSLPAGQTNKSSYTAETGAFELIEPSRAGYTFKGWTGTDIPNNRPVTPVVLNPSRDDFELKNRHYEANWTPIPDTPYKVEYYGENLEGTGYSLLAENYRGGTTDTEVEIDTTREFLGFTFDVHNENNVLTGTISGDPNNPTVLKAYYSRNTYTLTLDKDQLVDQTSGTGVYKYQELVPINATLGTKPGYTVKFYGWMSATTDVADIVTSNPSANFEMPAKNVRLIATTETETALNQYTVEYYYEGVDGIYAQVAEREAAIRTDKKTEEIAEIIEADKLPILEGYEYNETLTNPENNKEVAADGSTVLRVYFSRKSYTLTLVKGTNIATVTATENNSDPINSGETITVKYGKTVEITSSGYADAGYTFSFVNWTGTYSSLLGNANSVLTSFTMPHDNVTLTAVGKQDANTDTAYTIGYYYQANGAYPTNANTSVPMTGETGDIASIDLDDVVVPEGYALDTATIGANGTVNADNELYGTITGDGSLELKVFFKQQFTVEYKKGAHGASDFQERTFTGLDYGVTTPSYTGNTTPLPGYSFNGWDKTIANIVTENATYTAQYSLITYYISYDELYDNEPGLVTSYNVETDTFTIGHPTRYGYTFAGWTGSNGDTPEVDVTIPTGSTGDREYTANWTPETYTITYNLNGGALPQGQTNPETYTIETGLIELIDPSRAGYTFDGWTGTDIIGNPVTPVILNTLRDDFEPKNREYTANWTANTNTQYKIEYYGENLAGTGYELLAENYLSGTTDAPISIDTTREFTGFTFDSNNENNVLTGTISGDPNNPTVLKAYYSRNTYTVTLNSTDGITQVTGAGTYKYGQTVNIDAALDTRTGFDISFNKWESETQGVSDIVVSDPAYSFTMPAYNLTYKAVANVVALNARYIVEYYYEGDDGYETTPTTSDRTRQGQVGTEVWATTSDKISREVGYEYDQNKTEVVEQSDRVTVTADGNAKIRIYFKQSSYAVTLIAGDERITGLTITKNGVNNTGTTTVTERCEYGEYVTITADLGSETGYTIGFAGWSSNNTNVVNNTSNRTITFEVTDSVTLTATSTRTINSYGYTVEYFYNGNLGLTLPGTAEYNSTISYPSDKAPDNCTPDYRFDKYVSNGVDNTPLTISTNPSENIIQVYYLPVIRYSITGDMFGGTGNIQGVTESVIEGEDSEEEIEIIPDAGYKVKSIRLITGDEIDGDYEETDGENITVSQFYRIGMNYYLKNQFENVTENKHIVVWLEQSEPVAQIVSVPGNDANLGAIESELDNYPILNHTYYYLEDAIADAQKVNDNNTNNIDGSVEIKVLKNIYNEVNSIENGNNVAIDLNGHIISLEDGNYKNLTVQDGAQLQILNKGNVIDEITGRDPEIVNLEGVAIYVENGGNLTLGDDDGVVSIITPTIEGATFGIYREQGSGMNFYDGKVIGNTNSAIAGYTQGINTPMLHEVSIQTYGVKEIARVLIPSGYEAMIGRTKYETLEEAFAVVENDAHNNRNTPTEIDIIAEVTLEDPITLTENKSVILDLNGHNISVTQSNELFINDGKMEIKDSTSDILEGYTYAALVANGEYYFEKVGDHLEPNNSGVANSRANSYIVIDLSDKSAQDTFRLQVNTNTSNESGNYGYVTVTESAEAPVATNTNNRMVYQTGVTTPTTFTKELVGGTTYYLHLGYQKNDTNYYLDTFQVNDITLNGEPLISELVQSKGVITSSNYDTIQNTSKGELILSSGTISNGTNRYALNNSGKFTMTGGRLLGTCNVINNEATGTGKTVELNGGYIYGGIKNNAKATMIFDDDIRYYCYNRDYNLENRGGKIQVDGGTLTGTWYADYDGMFMRNYNYNSDACEIIINDGNIISANSAINCAGTFTMNGGNIKTARESLNISGTGIINDGSIEQYSCRWSDEHTVEGSGSIEINGGTIKSNATSAVTVANATITSGNISAAASAVKSNNITITGGNIYSWSTSADAIYTEGTLTVGTEDDDVSTTSPTIKGKYGGIGSSAASTVKFYDGQIIAPVGNTIHTVFTEIEDKNAEGDALTIDISQITENDTTYDRLTLIPVEKNIARIEKTAPGLNITLISDDSYTTDETYYYFNTLQDAITVCDSNAGDSVTTIELVKTFTTMDNAEIPAGKNIKLDLHGNKITSYASSTFLTNNGKLSIEDTVGGGEIKTQGTILNNTGTATINANLTFANKIGDRDTRYNVGTRIATNNVIINSGILTQNGGTISGYYSNIINNTNEFTMNNGTINAWQTGAKASGSMAILNTGSAKVTINGGTVNCNGGAWYTEDAGCIRLRDTSTAIINGGTLNSLIYVESSSSYVKNTSDPALYITGGTITGAIKTPTTQTNVGRDIWIIKDENKTLTVSGQIDVSADLRIENATVDSAITNNYGLSTTIIKSTLTNRLCLGYDGGNTSIDAVEEITNSTVSNIVKNTTGTLTINNTTVNGVTDSNYGVTVHNRKAGSIIIPSIGNTVINSAQYNTALRNSGGGTITLGTAGGGVNTEYPLINASNIGIYNENGTFNFYDGKIVDNMASSGTYQTISGNIGLIEPGYDIVKTIADGKETAILMRLSVAKVAKTDANVQGLEFVELDENYYGFYSLEDAFAACADGVQTNVIQIRDITYTESATTQTVPANKNIIFDMAGYKIITGTDETIVNNGTLQIINTNTTNTSSIDAKNNKLIVNNGTLLIEAIPITTTYAGTANNHATVIENIGTATFNNLTVNASSGRYGEFILNSGTLTINGGDYSGYGGDTPWNDYNVLTNTGDATIKEADMTRLPIVNDEHGTLEMIDMENFSSNITNNSDKVFGQGTSKPALRIKGGNYQMIISTWLYSGYGFKITNNAGEMIFENNTETNNELWINQNKNTGGSIINNSGIVNLKSGNITAVLTNTGTMNIEGGEFKPYETGSGGRIEITNNANGILNIRSSLNDRNITNNGIINIGDNSNQIDNNMPILNNTNITGSGDVNFYDGSITYAGIPTEKITSIPTGATVIVNRDGDNITYSLSTTEVIAKIGDDEYSSLKDAVTACSTSNNTVIELVNSFAMLDNNNIEIGTTQNITLNLNGNGIISYSEEPVFTNKGRLEVVDNSQEANGFITAYATGIVNNTGTLTVANGGYKLLSYNGNKIIIKNEGAGSVNVTGGSFNVSAYSEDYTTAVISSTSTGSVDVTGGTMQCYGARYKEAHAIEIINSDENITPTLTIGGTTNINGQSNSYNTGFYIKNARLTMQGGTVNGEYSNELVNSIGNITGGTINNKIDIDANSTLSVSNNATVNAMENEGTVTITGGTFKGELANRKNMTISNAVFTEKGNVYNDNYYGNRTPETTIENSNFNDVTSSSAVSTSGGTMTLKNVNIAHSGSYSINASGGIVELAENVNITNSGNGQGAYIHGGTLKIPYLTTNGNVNETTITATNGPGIEISSGTVTLGDKSYPVHTNYPEINGSTYGLKVTGGTVNFYDGILHGGTKAFDGTITDTPELYSLLFTDSNENTAYLQILPTVENVVKIDGGMNYPTVAAAINVINNSESHEGTIIFKKDVLITEPLTIPAGNTITFDMQGHYLKYFSEDENTAAITNNANLTINDSKVAISDTVGYVESAVGPAIENNGTLTVGDNSDNTVYTFAPRVIGRFVGIINSGTLNFYDGQIGTSETGNPVTVNASANLPTGYEPVLQGNNYILVAE